MEIELYNTYLKLKCSAQETDLVYEALSFKVPGAQFSHAYKKHRWDGYRRFYNKRTRRCDAGFLEIILELADSCNMHVLVHDCRKKLKTKLHFSEKAWHEHLKFSGIRAHPYLSKIQVDSVKQGLRAYLKDLPWRRGIFCIATGGGKTSLLGNLLTTINRPTLIMLGKLDLLYQTKDVLELLVGEDIGTIGDTKRDVKKYTILMSQTASRLLDDTWFKDYLKTIECVFLDEAHHLNDNTYYTVLKQLDNAYYRFALTATPLRRGDIGDAQLIGSFGSKIVDVKSKELRDVGALSDVVVYIHEFHDKNIPRGLQKVQVKKRGIFSNFERNDKIVDYAEKFKDHGWPCLILVNQIIEHGVGVQEAFNIRGLGKPSIINYKTPKNDRRELLNKLESGKVKYLIASVGVFGEGINAPNIRALIRAEGGSSTIKTLQSIGRGLRRKQPPNILYVVDFWDTHDKGLDLESRKRIATYEEEEILIRDITGADDIEFP